MASGDLTLRNLLRIPSWVEDVEDLIPTNLFKGLAISEDDKSIYIEAAVPGVDPKDVEVTFDRGLLTIRGEKKEEEKGKKYEKKATSSFFYQIDRDDVDPKAQIKAVCKNGQMKVELTKLLELQPKKIPVLTE